MSRFARALSLVAALALALVGASAARAIEPTCVSVCQQKVDACGAQCEALADAVYRDPASFEQCQLGCAKGLFTSCVEDCSQTGEVVADDYRLVAERPDHVPAPAPEETPEATPSP
jgi:hypothetical protein